MKIDDEGGWVGIDFGPEISVGQNEIGLKAGFQTNGSVAKVEIGVEYSKGAFTKSHTLGIELSLNSNYNQKNVTTTDAAGLRTQYDVVNAEGAGLRLNIKEEKPGGGVEIRSQPIQSFPQHAIGHPAFPVVLDLDEDGIDLVELEYSSAFYSTAGNYYRKLGWVSPDDALLAIDMDGDGRISRADEINFKLHHPDAKTDLEGVRLAFDGNRDGVLDARDARFTDFRVWQDKDGDGVADAGEVSTLAEADIVSIGLVGTGPAEERGGNTIHGTANYTRTNGTTGLVGDVAFKVSEVGFQKDETGKVSVDPGSLAGRIIVTKSRTGATVDVAAEEASVALGGHGRDTLINSGDENSLLFGGAGDDTLTGGSGSDWLIGDSGADRLSGGAGRDILLVDSTDTVDGGEGDDLVINVGADGLTLDLGAANVEAAYGNEAADRLTSSGSTSVVIDGAGGDDVVGGGSGADRLFGGDGNDHVSGGAGNDLVWGDGGNDRLEGGAGADSLWGGAGDDTLSGGAGADMLDGGEGNDRFEADAEDTIHGGAGFDTVVFTGGPVDFDLGKAGVEALTGTTGDDSFTGGAADEVIEGGAGADTISGGAGRDTASYAGSSTGVVVDLAAGTGAGGDAQGDQLSGIEDVAGSAHDDRLSGDAGANRLEGGAGDDTLEGRGGADTLSGGAGNDVLIADADDLLEGGAGHDTVLFEGMQGAALDLSAHGIEAARGTEAADTLWSSAGQAGSVTGAGGDDRLGGSWGATGSRAGPGPTCCWDRAATTPMSSAAAPAPTGCWMPTTRPSSPPAPPTAPPPTAMPGRIR
jgi:Ca2+-binding RTX toxin-like protein